MEFLEKVRWTSETPKIEISYYYEYQRSGADMLYRIKVVVDPVRSPSYFGYPIYVKVFSEGAERDSTTMKGTSPSTWSNAIEWTSNWWTVSNKTTGSSSLAINVYSGNGSSRNQSNYYNMYVAPAYTNVTKWEVASKTETSVTMNWATTHTCSQIRYGKNSTDYTTVDVNANSGTVTINNLDAYTGYNFSFMPKRKDNGMWGDGGDNVWKVTPDKTYGYPNVLASSCPDFNIESAVSLPVYNPLGKQCSISIYGADDSLIATVTTSGTTTGPILDDATSIIRLYSSISNSRFGAYKTTTTSGGHTETANPEAAYYVDDSLCSPLFDDFTIADVDEDTKLLTGNNKYQIVGYSDMAAIIYTEDKAVAQKGATMANYSFSIGNETPITIPYSPNLEVSEVFDNAPAGVFNVYAIDSRGLSTLVSKTPERVINYTPIIKSQITVERQDNVGEAVTLSFNGSFWGQSFGSVTNSITNVTYRFKKTTDQTWTTGITSITPIVSGNNYSFTGGIAGDTTQLGFDAGSSYNIEVTVYDELSSVTFTTTLGSGTPNMAFVENGVAMLGKYDESDTTNKVQINGNTKISGNESVNGDIDITGAYKINGTPLSIPTLDNAVSTTSTNGVENQAITNYVNSKTNADNWQVINNWLAYKKCGNIVTIRGYSRNAKTLNARAYTNLGNLPASVRPAYELLSNWAIIGESQLGLLVIGANGDVQAYTESGTSYWGFTITYVI